ncbi:MAG: hypothetical protein HY236_15685 [Acidobacteria bacterium]|nr:hypothetical protein [Acidobacteriota bacterium]
MSEEPKAAPNEPPEPASSETPPDEQDQDKEIGDFITRHVLEKDAVFFEG